jgi:uncharacterized membrane protein YdjX (TVP38/TMEM64 family)
MTRSSFIKLVAALAVIAALVVAVRMLPIAEGLEVFNRWVQEQGSFGMVLFALVYAVAAVLLLPGSVLTLAGGAAFGLLPGFVTILLGATLGAALAFLVSRHLARRWVEKWIESRPSFSAIDRAVAKEGWKIVFLTRLSPVFPFNFQNYAYGLTRVSFWHYTLASLVGMIPGTFMYVYFGTLGKSSLEAASGAQEVQGLKLALQVVGLIATVLVTIVITRTAKKALGEKIDSTADISSSSATG